MFDAKLRPLIDPPLNAIGRRLAALGATPNAVTWAGFLIGMAGCGAIVAERYWLALALILASRLADGLDGAVARATRKTDLGGFLDITLDFVFYAAVPAAFALADPANGTAAAVLLLAYMGSGASFLAFAAVAAKRGEETRAQGEKSIYYLAGLAEGFETILVTCAWCVFPAYFPEIAYAFAAVVAVSAAARVAAAYRALR